MVDKVAEVMAKAMGKKLITEGQEDNNPNPNEDGTSKKPEGTEETEGSESTEGAEGTEGTEGIEGENENGNDGDEGNSSGEQKSEGNDTDHGNDKPIIPGAKGTEESVQGKDFETTLAERSNGRFNSFADIEKALEEAPAGAFANEQIAKLNDYVKQGGSLNDFIKTQTVDYSTMSPDQLVKEHIMMTEGLTSDEADLMIEDSFGVQAGSTDRDKKLAEIKLKRESNKALAFLRENQQKWSVPQGADKQATDKAISEKWQADLGSAVKGVENIEISLNQTDKFSYKVEPDVLKKIQETMKRPEAFFKRYINADGTENVKKFVEDMVKLEQFDTIVRSASANNKASGKQEVIDEIKNPNFKGDNKSGKETARLTVAQQAAKAMYG